VKRIFVVDDEKPVVDGISLIVEKDLGGEFEVGGSASTGREALERVPSLLPDIVLMDVRMPGISGLETIRELRKRGVLSAFVLVTAYERFDIAREAVELGVVDYLLKPVSREGLARALRSAAIWADKAREAENREVAHREREDALAAHAETALLQGIALGAGAAAERAAILDLLGIGDRMAIVAAFALAAPPAAADPARELRVLHARLRDTLRYRSHALVGPLLAGLCPALVAGRDAEEVERRAREMREAIDSAFADEIGHGYLRVAWGRPSGMEGLEEGWSEALASLGRPPAHFARPGSTGGIGGPGGDSPGGEAVGGAGGEAVGLWLGEGAPPFDFSDDEDFLAALAAGDEAKASLALERILPSPSSQVTAVEAGRLASLFGSACRLFARRGMLDPGKAMACHDFSDLFLRLDVATLGLAARARFASILSASREITRLSPPVARTIAWIRDNYQRPIGLDLAAEAAGVSSGRLSRLFVEETGKGFSDWLIEYRIGIARELLLEPGASIKEVSLSCGYPDPNYFARLFKKVTGTTPSGWAEGRRAGGTED